ncbi:putative FecR, ferric citrate sensor [Nitrospira sp. KM1]|uniref:FecR family protein n=1 Tax=Nitrospira sp. KM1 TaxID=1936990 RepID=UPI0013A75ED2|nr:FecR family protein [Nitrospira sp. KM1]BCA56616.1 putative FecR, ferric citrate sensor [Nitrospira sp. KM1]
MSTHSQQAVDWFLRLRSEGCTEADRAAFQSWLSADPDHRKEFTEVRSMWGGMDKVLARPFPELEACLALPPRPASSLAGGLTSLGRWLTWSPANQFIPALLALVLVAGGWWLWEALSVQTAIYETAVGEQKTVTLADGSRLDLNTGTRVTTAFSSRRRSIELLQGEAAFTVVHQSDRSFTVSAGGRHILDIGTQFVVHQHQNRIDVTVTQGSVLISRDEKAGSSSSGESVVLEAGHRLRYVVGGQDDGGVIALDPTESHRSTAWRDGKLIFSGVRLAEAVQEVNRYWPGQIVIDAPNLADVKVQGVFNVRQLDQFFTTLPRILPVEVSRRSPQYILITARHSGSSN